MARVLPGGSEEPGASSGSPAPAGIQAPEPSFTALSGILVESLTGSGTAGMPGSQVAA